MLFGYFCLWCFCFGREMVVVCGSRRGEWDRDHHESFCLLSTLFGVADETAEKRGSPDDVCYFRFYVDVDMSRVPRLSVREATRCVQALWENMCRTGFRVVTSPLTPCLSFDVGGAGPAMETGRGGRSADFVETDAAFAIAGCDGPVSASQRSAAASYSGRGMILASAWSTAFVWRSSPGCTTKLRHEACFSLRPNPTRCDRCPGLAWSKRCRTWDSGGDQTELPGPLAGSAPREEKAEQGFRRRGQWK